MEISRSEEELIKSIIKIEKRIHSIYSFNLATLKKPEDQDKSIEALLAMISKEDELIEALNLTKEKLKHIERTYAEKVGLSIDTNLPLGLSYHINSTNYPYYRMIARMRYACSKKNSSAKHILDPYLLDNEINLLYIAIMQETERHDEASFKKSLLEYSWLILMDSPTVEIETLKRKMAPEEYVDDCIEFHADIVYWAYVDRLRHSDTEMDKSLLEEYMKPQNIIDTSRASGKYRAPRASVQFKEAVLDLYKQDSNMEECRTPNFYVKIAYLKTIIAFFDKRSREATYNTFLSSKILNQSKYPWLMDLIKDNICDLETNFVPHIRKIALNPAYKIS